MNALEWECLIPSFVHLLVLQLSQRARADRWLQRVVRRRWNNFNSIWDMNTVVRVDAQSSRELVNIKIRAKCSVKRASCGSKGTYSLLGGWGLWASWWGWCTPSRQLWGLNRRWSYGVDLVRRSPRASPCWRTRAGIVFARGLPIVRRRLRKGRLRSRWRGCGYSVPRFVNAHGMWHWCGHYRRRVSEWSWARVGTANPARIGLIRDYCFGRWASRLFRSNLIRLLAPLLL